MSTKPTAKTTVTLAKPHTHQGKAYAEGDKITVSEATAQWLKDNGVTAAPAANTATKEAK